MTSESLIGVDVGTSSARAVLFDLRGETLAHAECAYSLHTPQPGWVEQSPDEVWRALCAILRRVADQARQQDARPVALALACQSGSVTLVDESGAPIYPNITWMDGRAEPIVQEWQAQGLSTQLRRWSGWMPHPGLALPTLAWLRRHRPDLMARARRALSMNDYLTHCLTGRYCSNPSNAAVMQLLSIAEGDWHPELCRLAGIDRAQLSPVLPSGASVGPLTSEASALTGLPPDLWVVNGGHDQSCTALSVGVTQPGQVLLACGTSWVVTDAVDRPEVSGVPAAMDLSFHAAPQRWTISQSLGGLGSALDWWLNQCWPAAPGESAEARAARYHALNAELERSAPGARGLVFAPIAGGHASPAGMQQGGFIGLQLHHTRGDMTRAVMESAAYELHWALQEMRAAGLRVDEMFMVGGAARSAHWPQMVADITGAPLAVSRYPHWPALGAAILAGWGVGLFDSIDAGRLSLSRPVVRIQPDADRHAAHALSFARYQALMRAV